MNAVSDQERRRAVNLIWNAAQSYHFVPDFKAYDAEGHADLYWNSIIGAVRRHYEYPKIAAVFASFGQYEDGDCYEGLLWLGLENAVFQKEKQTRPALQTLRLAYAKQFLSTYADVMPDDFHLYDCLAYAHFQRILGIEPRINRYDRSLLDELEFSPEMDTDEIVARAKALFAHWFQIVAEEKRHRRRFPLLFIPKNVSHKAKDRYRRFGIGFADHPPKIYTPEEEQIQEDNLIRSSLSETELREFMSAKYGASMFDARTSLMWERRLCTGSHKNCHLLFTKGVRVQGKIQNGFEALKREQEQRQITRNREAYREHLAENRVSIARLATKIQNSILLYLQPNTVRSFSGTLDTGHVWRAETLRDDRVFYRKEQENMGDLSVDILLDASTSQLHRQEMVSAQGYMIAEAMNRCGIPCRVMSFCSMTGYTILRVFRDYQETQANRSIFEFVSNGCNRDGLALRAAHELMMSSPYEHRVLILLSDVKPHDAVRICTENGAEYQSYEKDAGVRDTALEVRRARADGIAVICVFTGEDEDLSSAKLVYGKDFARIPTVDKLADAVGSLLQNQIRNL